MTRGLLISFAGYPYTLTSLMPDNGLANLAGALIAAGHEVKVFDYGTIDLIRRLVPRGYANELRKIYKELIRLSPRKKLIDKIKIREIGLKLKAIEYLLARQLDKNNYIIAQELSDLIKKEKPSFVGFKLWLGDGLDSSIKIASLIKKEYPDLKIYGGGPLIDLVKETFYKKTKIFDAIVYSEGEETIVRLANHSVGREALRNIPNLIYIEGNQVIRTERKRVADLNELPFPVYDDNVYPSLKDNTKIKILTLDESRGCPNHCGFCPHIEKSGNFWRVKEPSRIISEMSYFISNYSINAFRYGGSNPPFNILVRVAKKIIEKGIKVNYSSFAHVNNFDISKLQLLKQSGLQALSFGVESGDKEILKKVMLKNVTPEEIKNVLKKTIEAGIFTIGSIIFPSPYESRESKRNTLNLSLDIFKNNDKGSVQVYFPGLYPNSIWGSDPTKYGFALDCDMSSYVIKYMNYKIKRLFPPSFWKPLPYKINNKSFKEYSKETENMVKELESNSILTMASDELALMSYIYNPQLSMREFRDKEREILFVGDYEEVSEIVYKLNQNIKNDINKL